MFFFLWESLGPGVVSDFTPEAAQSEHTLERLHVFPCHCGTRFLLVTGHIQNASEFIWIYINIYISLYTHAQCLEVPYIPVYHISDIYIRSFKLILYHSTYT